MNNPITACAITATKQSGKDTLVRHLISLNPRFTRFGFADRLRDDLAPFVRQYFDKDVWTTIPIIKEGLRPLLIGYGMAQRAFNEDHWVARSVGHAREIMAKDPLVIPIWSDGRFVNEIRYLRAEFGDGFRLINLTREGAPPPTDEEEKHFRQVAAMADFHLHWGGEDEEGQREKAREVLRWLGLDEVES